MTFARSDLSLLTTRMIIRAPSFATPLTAAAGTATPPERHEREVLLTGMKVGEADLLAEARDELSRRAAG